MCVVAHAEYSLAELAKASGQSPRTIRFYIARNILPGPIRAGRNARYGEEHLGSLRQIKSLQAQGLTLAEIGAAVKNSEAPALPRSTLVHSFDLACGVSVTVRPDLSPWGMNQVLRILAEANRQLQVLEKSERKE